jgi:alkylhydroperoxidase/carboxymuconolactone decarboxylase family protein YurZ
MQLDEMVQCFVAIGASIGVDCESCLQSCIVMARQCGASQQDIDAAMAVARMVRECAGKAKQTAESQGEKSRTGEKGFTICCGSNETNI